MKKLVFALFAFLLVGSVSAQDHEKAYKKAKRLLATYNMNPNDSGDKLEQALERIEYAMTGDLSGIKNPYEPYLVKGDVYKTVAGTQIAAKQAAKEGSEAPPAVEADNPSYIAFEAYNKALELATKKTIKKVLEGHYGNQNNLANSGIQAYEGKDYAVALKNFEAVLAVNKTLKDNGKKSTLDAEGAYDNQVYLAGLAALNLKDYKSAEVHFKELYDSGFDDSIVYTALYAIGAKDDPEGAYKYLEAGRQKYPNDNSLLFEEINHFLRIKKLDELIGKLEKAIQIEPENISLYTTLGNVYDNLYQREVKAGNAEAEKEYFDKALANYNIAVEKDPKNVDAQYSIGALYYNKAALVTQEMMKLQDDFTKAGMKKYDTLKGQSVELFNQGLPYFKKAESLNPNDVNTLIALKEIFARTDDIEKSNEFKTRLETVQNGGKNNASYFNE